MGGGWPWAEHAKCMSVSLWADIWVCTLGANLGGIFLVGSISERKSNNCY